MSMLIVQGVLCQLFTCEKIKARTSTNPSMKWYLLAIFIPTIYIVQNHASQLLNFLSSKEELDMTFPHHPINKINKFIIHIPVQVANTYQVHAIFATAMFILTNDIHFIMGIWGPWIPMIFKKPWEDWFPHTGNLTDHFRQRSCFKYLGFFMYFKHMCMYIC